jgi:hypothetical protein
MKLNLTNTGSDPCILRGYAGVSLTADAAGAPIGAPAVRDESTAAVDVLLAPGQTGSAVLRYTQAGNYSDCALVDAAGYRIYPPEDTESLFLRQPTRACSNGAIRGGPACAAVGTHACHDVSCCFVAMFTSWLPPDHRLKPQHHKYT